MFPALENVGAQAVFFNRGTLLAFITARTFCRMTWRRKLETMALPCGAILVSLFLFGVFCIINDAQPLAVFASIKKGAFGSWFALQSTLVRAAPLMLCALCTAIPGILFGAFAGYLIGTCVAGVFLLMDKLEPFLPGGKKERA